MSFHWPDMDRDAKVAAVVDLRDAGKRKDEIAAALNVDANTLTWFAWKNGIAGLSVQTLTAKSRVAMVPDDRMVDPKAWDPLGPAVTLEHNTGCCWPVEDGSGEFKQCGRRKPRKGSYCSEHHALAYGKPRPMAKQSVDWLADSDRRGSDRVEREQLPVAVWKNDEGEE